MPTGARTPWTVCLCVGGALHSQLLGGSAWMSGGGGPCAPCGPVEMCVIPASAVEGVSEWT